MIPTHIITLLLMLGLYQNNIHVIPYSLPVIPGFTGSHDWVLHKREDHECVSWRLIHLEAKKIAKERAGYDGFSASWDGLRNSSRAITSA